jgi:hypothetical protein
MNDARAFRPTLTRKGVWLLLAWFACATIAQAAIAEPRPKSVRIVYLVSADRPVRDDFKNAVAAAAKDLQAWYAKQLGGPTFRLNEPIVEVARSDKEARWFYDHPTRGHKDGWGYDNGLAEARFRPTSFSKAASVGRKMDQSPAGP